MIDFFWSFKRKVSLILPQTLDIYDVSDYFGNTKCKIDSSSRKVSYYKPQINLKVKIRRVFEINNTKFKIVSDRRLSEMYSVSYKQKQWDDTSVEENRLELQEWVLQQREPYLMVASSDLISIEKALRDIDINV